VEGAVLALEVQHGHGLGGLGLGRLRRAGVLHVTMLPAARFPASHRLTGLGDRLMGIRGFRPLGWFLPRAAVARMGHPASVGSGPRTAVGLKRFVNAYNVVTLRDLAGTGFPEPRPPICLSTKAAAAKQPRE
jgi:hypothetical protein